MSFFKSTLWNNLVNEGELPTVPVSFEVPTRTWVQVSAIGVFIISLIVIGVILIKNN